jgi:LmbE family N-acetylglucosaminyl deacetylase
MSVPTLLAIIPHPDDESYSIGGTIALAARAGWRCVIECATYGEQGKRHDGGPVGTNAVAEVREAELAASCKVLWAEEPRFWGLPDGSLRLHRGETNRIQRLFRQLDPALVLTLGEDGAYGHPDHTAVHRWVTEAWVTTPEPRPALLYAAFPRGLFLPQYEKCIGMMGDPPTPPPAQIGAARVDYEIRIAGVERPKVRAIAAHRSQLPNGDPEALFPRGIIPALLDVERFTDARGAPDEATGAVLASFA